MNERNISRKKKARQNLMVFSSLLLTLIVFVVLFGTGVLRFGNLTVINYVIYIFAGLFSAFLTFQIMESTGELTGNRWDTEIKLGGAIVALVVVAGGGGLYERFLYTPDAFGVQVYLVNEDSSIAAVPGELILRLPSQQFRKDISTTGEVFFQGIPSQFRGQKARISLQSDSFRLQNTVREITLNPDRRIEVIVEKLLPPVTETQLSISIQPFSIIEGKKGSPVNLPLVSFPTNEIESQGVEQAIDLIIEAISEYRPIESKQVALEIVGSELKSSEKLIAQLTRRYTDPAQSLPPSIQFGIDNTLDIDEAFRLTGNPFPTQFNPNKNFLYMYMRIEQPKQAYEITELEIYKLNEIYSFERENTILQKQLALIPKEIKVLIPEIQVSGDSSENIKTKTSKFDSALRRKLDDAEPFKLSGLTLEELNQKRQEILKIPASSPGKSLVINQNNVDFIVAIKLIT